MMGGHKLKIFVVSIFFLCLVIVSGALEVITVTIDDQELLNSIDLMFEQHNLDFSENDKVILRNEFKFAHPLIKEELNYIMVYGDDKQQEELAVNLKEFVDTIKSSDSLIVDRQRISIIQSKDLSLNEIVNLVYS